MPRKSLHQRIKEAELGKAGQPEVDVPGGRVDGVVRGTAIQVAVDPSMTELREDARVLKTAPQKRKVIVVNKGRDVPKAAQAMREEGLGGTARTPKRPRGLPTKKIRVLQPKR